MEPPRGILDEQDAFVDEEEEDNLAMPARSGRSILAMTRRSGEGSSSSSSRSMEAVDIDKDEDEDDAGEWCESSSEGGDGDAFAKFDRQNEAIVFAELQKAEEALYAYYPEEEEETLGTAKDERVGSKILVLCISNSRQAFSH